MNAKYTVRKINIIIGSIEKKKKLLVCIEYIVIK